ncbi:BnaA01g29340D [Brassica napus]|uniref:BnaA01g29340D protein n=1 Tax=Brassica napus TaxID=3708 RepID=A0A078HMM1_BRANA|nr:BnaA01g29340D [Brassica napus]
MQGRLTARATNVALFQFAISSSQKNFTFQE